MSNVYMNDEIIPVGASIFVRLTERYLSNGKNINPQ